MLEAYTMNNARPKSNLDTLDHVLKCIKNIISDSGSQDVSPVSFTALRAIRSKIDENDKPTWFKNSDGNVLYMNQAYKSAYGFIDVVSTGKFLFKTGSFDDLAAYEKLMDEGVLKKGEPFTFVEDIEVDGKLDSYKISKSPIYLEGEVLGILCENLGIHNEQRT